jgi:hypothetical protein
MTGLPPAAGQHRDPDRRHQGYGYSPDVVQRVAELVRPQGAAELLMSYVPRGVAACRPGSTGGSGSCRRASSTTTARFIMRLVS